MKMIWINPKIIQIILRSTHCQTLFHVPYLSELLCRFLARSSATSQHIYTSWIFRTCVCEECSEYVFACSFSFCTWIVSIFLIFPRFSKFYVQLPAHHFNHWDMPDSSPYRYPTHILSYNHNHHPCICAGFVADQEPTIMSRMQTIFTQIWPLSCVYPPSTGWNQRDKI